MRSVVARTHLTAVVAMIAVVGLPSLVRGQAIKITHPSAGQAVGGISTFSAATTAGAIESVEFDIGSRKIGVAKGRPFAVAWNTGYASDGTYALQAYARDVKGAVVATADQLFTINNHDNSLNVTSPDLSETLHGTVTLTVAGHDSQYFPALWMVLLDGENRANIWTDNAGLSTNRVSVRIDTTSVPNGSHELYVGMHSDLLKPVVSWHNFRGGFERVINIDNGHTLMEVAANHLHIYLQPGQELQLTCRQLFTDGTSGTCAAPSWTSSDTGVASVSRSGLVTANVRGFANIALSDKGKTSAVHVWIRTNLNVPHFAGDGKMLTSYQPGSSVFFVAPFASDISEFQRYPGLAPLLKAGGINTLSQGFYNNPRDLSATYLSWRVGYDLTFGAQWAWAKNNGFHIYAAGDDMARQPGNKGDAYYTIRWPWGKEAARYAMERLASSRIAIGIDMVDEVNSLWGGCPTCNVWDSGAITTITAWLHGASPNVPISWPVLGISNPVVFSKWEGVGSLSDYASEYWDSLSLRRSYAWSMGVQEAAHYMAQFFYQRQPYVMLDRPQVILTCLSSWAYTKETPGAAFYTPPRDLLDTPGCDGRTVMAEMMTAAALGSAGERGYQWEPTTGQAVRASAPVGSYFQTGTNPIAADPFVAENWKALSVAAPLLTETLAPYLLGTALNSPAYGRNIITAARQNRSSKMLMVVNDNGWSRTLSVDFNPFRTGSPIARYEIDSSGTVKRTLPDESSDTILLGAGASVVYLFK